MGPGCQFLLQGGLPYPGIEAAMPAKSPVFTGGFFTSEPLRKPYFSIGIGTLRKYQVDKEITKKLLLVIVESINS